ncbi:EAL domain [Candidatus Terasakiella magnetica]|uniref:EAL domain n=1 Tax=Candidatus Terasakiella magnetica TaxID=1867952 RepID=A0A1C3RE17_9PROT|nr:EAL domain-containing protein [Candidatus Terasakiella magnetica]SCA55540.1 EAL domain [Candidatus Terasakiella magnetica]
MADIDALKLDKNRFVKLAFCRADLLFEVDSTNTITFVAGATEAIFGKSAEQLAGSPFLELIIDKQRTLTQGMLDGTSEDQRIEDAAITLVGQKNIQLPCVMAGYRTPEFDNNAFLALKIVASPKTDISAVSQEPEILNQEDFSQAAANHLQDHQQKGGQGQVTLVKVKRIKDLFKLIGASDRQSLSSAITDVLKNYSLGKNTAGQISEDSFGYAHTTDVDTDKVNMEIEEAAQKFLPEGEEMETSSLTVDADGAAMSEDQVAKALVHTMQQFCSQDKKVTATRLSDSLDEMMNGTVETVKFIKQTTRDKDFDLVYMPICDMRLGKVHHFEVLSRFKQDDKTPPTFQIITLAENLELIVDLDFAIFEKTIAQMHSILSQGSMLPSVAINVSSISLRNPRFIQEVHNRLEAYPGLTQRLMFELTESAEVHDLEQTNAIIQDFREKGFKFCLDDFGAGAASFDYLNALEVDIVKFDGPVVRRACASKRGHDLLSTMAKMCTTTGIETVAEMVEDKKIANQVYYCGIDYGQGWYFGKPHPDPLSFQELFAGKD